MEYRRTVAESASEDRLQKLIEERLQPGADKRRIDKRIWDLFGEEWCVMFTDLAGFSRGVARFGIIHFLQTIYESERLLIPIIERHDGILLKVEGDSFLVIFRNVQKALTASIEMQRRLEAHNLDRTPEEQVLVSVGLGFGSVLRIGDSDVFGFEVNAASRLGEDVARASEILVTNAVREASDNADGVTFEAIDDEPVGADKAYRVAYRD
ncbi:MAG TPA: adenylate/guanylate cyclase domain-containing protein [Thermoanaerobaculia bacterium]|nr:adenylate/guanylate cyclase domain-containing protein [Thermoanaerobaculia bacterium]